MQENDLNDWVLVVTGDLESYPPPHKDIECVMSNSAFPDGFYHFFGKRKEIERVTNCFSGRRISLSSIAAWRLVKR